MLNTSMPWVKKTIVSVWFIGTLCLLAMTILTDNLSLVGKIALISIIITAFLGPLALYRNNSRRFDEDSES